MKLLHALIIVLVMLAVAGCTGIKAPPGWPAGEERPINPPHLTRPGT